MRKLLLFLFFCMCGPAYGINIKVGLPLDVIEKDPFDLVLLEESEIYASINDNLVIHQALTGFEPTLAERWEFNKLKKIITFHLKPNLKFSDGSNLDANDVEFTFKRLIILDKEENLTLTKCLSRKGEVYNDINRNHPLIHVVNKNTIAFGPMDCGDSLLGETSDPHYGIVSKKFVGKDLKLIPGAATSGAFTYKKNLNGFTLIPNKYNWRWMNAKDHTLTFTFLKIDQSFSSVLKNEIDILRTSNKIILEESRKHGFNASISLPIMIWFLAGEASQLKEIKPLLNFINYRIKQRKYKVFENNLLETSANSFYPKEFNCDYGEKKLLDRPLPTNKMVIRLINHRSRESEIYIDDLKKELESNGITVLIDEEKPNFKGKVMKLFLKRQFLGDGALQSLSYAFRVTQSIPDPDRKIIRKLELLDQESLTDKEKINLMKSTCDDLHFFNHVPLSHRKYAFIYKNEKYRELFSKGNGNLIYNKLIK